MTEVAYNGVTLRSVQTLRFDESAQYDESNTDLLYHKFSIRVAGSIHPDRDITHGVDIIGISSSNATSIMRAIHDRLMQPRHTFVFRNGPTTLIRATQGDPSQLDVDVDNGPKPRNCNITQIAGRQLYRVEFDIDIAVVRCSPSEQQQFPTFGAQRDGRVLNNRWSMADTIDENHVTTRTVEGTLRVAHINYWPHFLRYLTVPALQPGYKREAMRFVDSPDGLVLKYLIVDRQHYASPPPSATSWKCTFRDVTGRAGATAFSEMHVHLQGAPRSNTPFELLEDAIEVVFQRLGNLRKQWEQQAQGKHPFVLEHMAITESLHTNAIDVHVRIQHIIKDRSAINTRIDPIGTKLNLKNYDPDRWRIPGLFDGVSPAAAFAKYWQSPCDTAHGIVRVQQLQGARTVARKVDQGSGEQQIFQASTPIKPDDQSGISAEQRGSFPYLHYEIESRYVTGKGVIQLPIARANGEESDDTVRIFRLHQGAARRIITIRAERVGDWPTLPSQDEIKKDANEIEGHLVDCDILPEAPQLTADGKTRTFRIEARYVYALTRPVKPTERLEAGADPREQGTPADNQYDQERLITQDIV